MEEYFDIVTENNTPTGERRTRRDAHSQGLWHRTVHIYLFRENKGAVEVLVHLRAKTKDLNPNRWDPRFGGHIKAGESSEEAAVGELKDEIGLSVEFSDLIKGEVYKRDKFPNREFTNAYYYNFSGETSRLKFNDGEVQEVKWMGWKDILRAMREKPKEWSGSPMAFKKQWTFF